MRRRSFLTLTAAGIAAWSVAPETGRAAPPTSAAPGSDQLRELAKWVSAHGGKLSAAVYDAETGKLVAEHDSTTALNPASNMKILTATIVLEELGPGYGFVTGLYGKQNGDTVAALTLRGHGDPSLGTKDIWRLANALENRGVSHVGDIFVDQSYFDDEFVPPAFGQQPEEWAAFRAPVSAIAVERNTATLNVLAAEAGKPARVWFEPDGVAELEGAVKTVKRGKGQNVLLTLKPTESGLRGKVGGYVAEGLPRLRFPRRLEDPRLAPGLVLRELLRQVGIKVSGKVALGGADSKSRLVYQRSEPTSVLLQELGKHSDNFYAEMLFKAVGAERSHGPGSSKAGAEAALAWLDAHGLGNPKTTIENGSGLFDANRLSARQLAHTLLTVHNDSKLSAEFTAQLSIGGVDGTLRSRFRSLKERRAVRAKTGTLAAADALSGFVTGPDKTYAFSLLVNDIVNRHAEVRRRMDAVVTALATTRTGKRATP